MNPEEFLSVFSLMLMVSGSALLTVNRCLPSIMLSSSRGASHSLLSINPLLALLNHSLYLKCSVIFLTLFLPAMAFAAEESGNPVLEQQLDLTDHWAGYLALIIFTVAYILAMTEEVTELKKIETDGVCGKPYLDIYCYRLCQRRE